MPIFDSVSLDQHVASIHDKIDRDIEAIPLEELAQANKEALAKELAERYAMTTPVLRDEWELDEPPQMLGHTEYPVTVHVPFDGDPTLLRVRPRAYPMFQHAIDVRGNELVIQHLVASHNIQRLKGLVEDDIKRIRDTMRETERMVTIYNGEMPRRALAKIEDRVRSFQQHNAFVDSLNSTFKIRRRTDDKAAIIMPVQRKQAPVIPKPGSPKAAAEPAITMDAYEDILSVISSMVQVMERSPKAFEKMKEEELRTVLLVALNGLYEGQAKAETFNGAGKTDILIAVKDKSVFIAECLVWSGEKYLQEKMDEQLFTYATWRDSKLALIVFNRKKDFSETIKKMRDVCASHAQHVRSMPYTHESASRYVFHRSDDRKKEFILTAIAFDVPT